MADVRIFSYLPNPRVWKALIAANLAGVDVELVCDKSRALASRMAAAYEFFLSGIEQALSTNNYIAGEELSIADIGIVCDVAQFLRDRLMAKQP